MSQRQRTPPSRLRAQRGMSLIGLMAWAIIVGFIGYLAVRVLPTVNEYLTVQRAVDRVASEAPATVGEVRRDGSDLMEGGNGNDKVVVNFAYDKEIPIVQPVYLLLKYQGQSK